MASSSFVDQSLKLDIGFLPFVPHRCDSLQNGGTSIDTTTAADSVWCSYTQSIDNDLHYLLKLNHKRFWAQVIQDDSLNKLIDSYLQHAPRPNDSLSQMSTRAKDCLRNIHKRVFMTLLRLSTHQETQDFPISIFSDLIYNNRIFTIPRILDMCSVYGQSNIEVLRKMVGNVFDKQPKYVNDLTLSINRITKQVFEEFTSKCGSMDDDSIDSVFLERMVKYFCDIAHTFKSLLSVFPSSTRVLWETNLPEKLVTFFEANIPTLKSQVKQSTTEDIECQSSMLLNCLKQGIKDTCEIINTMIMSRCNSGPVGVVDSASNADSLITLFNTMITDKIFLKEFERYFNVRNVLDKVQSSISNFDEAQVDYILSAIRGGESMANDEVVKSKPRPMGGAKKENTLEATSKIQHIKEILPHLETEFIKECLKEFNGDPEVVIQRYLDGHLPPYLMSIVSGTQQPLEEVPSAITPGNNEPHPPVAELVDSRVGLYDYDEFDLMHNTEVDWSKIHKGKKHDSARSILSDRSHVSLMKGRGLDLLPDFDEYDDEYDDTYDSQIVGATDQDSADELPAIQRLNEKGKYSNKQNWYTNTENTETSPRGGGDQSSVPNIDTQKSVVSILKRQDNQTTKTSKNQTKDRHQKGEGGARVDVRIDDHKLTKTERKEQLQQEEKKGNQSHREKGGDGGKTQIHRQYKERNKSSRANHNRKMASDKKRKAF